MRYASFLILLLTCCCISLFSGETGRAKTPSPGGSRPAAHGRSTKRHYWRRRRPHTSLPAPSQAPLSQWALAPSYSYRPSSVQAYLFPTSSSQPSLGQPALSGASLALSPTPAPSSAQRESHKPTLSAGPHPSILGETGGSSSQDLHQDVPGAFAPPAAGNNIQQLKPEPASSPLWRCSDEIRLVTACKLMQTTNGYFDAAGKLTAGDFIEALQGLQRIYRQQGVRSLRTLPPCSSRFASLTREEAVALLVKALVPEATPLSWTSDTVSAAVQDYAETHKSYGRAVALAAERLLVPNPLQPARQADRAFAAVLLARAFPWNHFAPSQGPFVDEIRKALDMHLLYTSELFLDGGPVTTAELARALDRARQYLPPDRRTLLPDLPLTSPDPHSLTRGEALSLVVSGLVADSHFGSRTASSRGSLVDSDVRVVFALKPHDYLASFDDIKDLVQSPFEGAIAVAAYKGWLPNLGAEPGKLRPNAIASRGYIAHVLARAVNCPGDYTGVIIDLSGLRPVDRSGSMWVLNAGERAAKSGAPVQVYPSTTHLPVRSFFSAPGVIGYYGDIQSAKMGRAGPHPLVIKALDWARYDWTFLHGAPGLRRGGGKAISLAQFHFVRGTPPLVLLSPEDCRRLEELDHTSLLLRTARVGLVHSHWSLKTAQLPVRSHA